jgi:hypothetical protein
VFTVISFPIWVSLHLTVPAHPVAVRVVAVVGEQKLPPPEIVGGLGVGLAVTWIALLTDDSHPFSEQVAV